MPLDQQRDRIKVSVDPDLRTLIPAFLQHRQEEIALLKDALDHADYETINQLSHTIKGVGGGYGFHGLMMMATQMEQSARKQNFEEIKNGLDAMADYLSRVDVVYESVSEP